MIRQPMLIVIAALLATVAFAVLVRLLWLSARPARSTTLVTLAAVALVAALAVLALTGRLHWLAAVAAAVAPFLRRAVGLLRYVPWFGGLARRWRAGRQQDGPGSGRRTGGSAMSRAQALEVLGLEGNPGRDEILAAHRRLIQRLHPDRGGSKFLAQQLNEAKARLLDRA